MDKKLQMINRLYADKDVEGAAKSEISDLSLHDDGAGGTELARLSEAKYLLDRRERLRPDAAVIDRIVAEAARSSTRSGKGQPAGSRNVMTLLGARIYPLRLVAAASVLVVATVFVWRQWSPAMPDAQRFTAETEINEAEADGDLRSAERVDDVGLVAASPSVQGEKKEVSGRRNAPLDRDMPARLFADDNEAGGDVGFAVASKAVVAGMEESLMDSVPAWEDADDFRLLQRRIEMLRRASADLDWEESVPLEQLPLTRPRPGFIQAGKKQ